MSQRTLKKLQYNSTDIQVESAIRDGVGNNIASTYARKAELPRLHLDIQSTDYTTTPMDELFEEKFGFDSTIEGNVLTFILELTDNDDTSGNSYLLTVKVSSDSYVGSFYAVLLSDENPLISYTHEFDIPLTFDDLFTTGFSNWDILTTSSDVATAISDALVSVGAGDVAGPSSSTNNNVAIFDGVTGKIIKDGGHSLSEYVAGPASSTNNRVAVFDGTTGKLIKDGGHALSEYLTAHPTITTSTDTTSTDSPAHGGTFDVVDSVTRDSNGHVTKVNTKTVTLPADNNTDTKVTQAYSTTNSSYPLLMCATAGITSTASRGAKTAIVNNQLYANPSTGALYAKVLYQNGTAVVGTDTKNTAGSTNTSSKIFLIGATSQAANPQTYSQDTAYVGTDGCLYSGGTKVLTAHQTIPTATKSAYGTAKMYVNSVAGGTANISSTNTSNSTTAGNLFIRSGTITTGTEAGGNKEINVSFNSNMTFNGVTANNINVAVYEYGTNGPGTMYTNCATIISTSSTGFKLKRFNSEATTYMYVAIGTNGKCS